MSSYVSYENAAAIFMVENWDSPILNMEKVDFFETSSPIYNQTSCAVVTIWIDICEVFGSNLATDISYPE
jgi:hypothetical protein